MKQILPPKIEHKLQKVDTDRLQDQRKNFKNQKPTPNPPIETKTNLKLKWTQRPQSKSQGNFKKTQTPPPLARLEEYIRT